MALGPVFNKTRLAPTPSGFLHLGNIFSFALTTFLARKAKAKILLRIDDMDRERVQIDYINDIFDTLNFLSIPYDVGPKNSDDFEANFSQLKRNNLYEEALKKLVESKLVYACECSRSQIAATNSKGAYAGTCRHKGLPLDKEGVSWRIISNNNKPVIIKDINGNLHTHFLPDNMCDFVVRKKDGFAAYQLTSLIDDVHFGVDFIVRGEDLWPSSLAQMYLAETLNLDSFKTNTFYHHQLLRGYNGLKLSKTAGDTSVHYLRQQQKTAEEIYNLIGQMLNYKFELKGWQHLVSEKNISWI